MDNKTRYVKSDTLQHHGVLGMRWGARNRRDISEKKLIGSVVKTTKKPGKSVLNATKKIGGGMVSVGKKINTKRVESKAKKHEKLMNKLVTSTDPTFIYKHKSKMSDWELRDRIERINSERMLSDMRYYTPGNYNKKNSATNTIKDVAFDSFKYRVGKEIGKSAADKLIKKAKKA